MLSCSGICRWGCRNTYNHSNNIRHIIHLRINTAHSAVVFAPPGIRVHAAAMSAGCEEDITMPFCMLCVPAALQRVASRAYSTYSFCLHHYYLVRAMFIVFVPFCIVPLRDVPGICNTKTALETAIVIGYIGTGRQVS